MADNEIGIVISATDKASGVLKKIVGENKAMATAIGLAAIAITAAGVAASKAINEYVKYADEVRKLSQLNGTSARETSRLIQVTDDYKVSVQTLTMATRKLSQEGLSLTIDSLAKLSDEYNNLGSNADKTKFLLEKFGRSGLEMVEVMKQGGQAILDQSKAIDKNLILTEKQVKAARDYQFQQDALNDKMQGFKVAAGNYFLPYLIKIVDGLIKGTEYAQSFIDRVSEIGASTPNKPEAATAWGKFWDQTIEDAVIGIKGFEDVVYRGGSISQYIGGVSEAAIISQKKLNVAIGETATAVGGLGDAVGSMSDAEESFLLSTQEMIPKVIAEFYAIQKRVEEVKRMIAKGVSFTDRKSVV